MAGRPEAMHPLLTALLALPAALAGVTLSLLLALGVAWSGACALCWELLWGRCNSRRPPRAGSHSSWQVAEAVSMHGMQLEQAPGDATVVTVPDADTAARAEVLAWFDSHGSANSNTYTTFSNPEMLVFLVPGGGVQPYTVARHWGRRLVCAVGDPVCQPEHTGLIQQLFRQSFPAAVFMDLSKGAAQQLVAHNPSLLVNDIGAETVVDVARYDFESNKKTKHIRRRAEAAASAGLIVEEVTGASSPGVRAQLEHMALQWQQGKECTDDIKVFSRAIPWGHLGCERDVRVFIARTLQPGEAPPLTAAAAAALLLKKQAVACHEQPSGGNAPAPPLSRKQRKLRERVQHAKSLRALSAAAVARDGDTSMADDTKERTDSEQHPAAADSASSLSPTASSVAAFEVVPGFARQSPSCASLAMATTASSSGSSTTSSSGSAGGTAATGSSSVHACVVLDPVHSNGQVVGYMAERSFLSPSACHAGALKLVLREALGLLRAEGRQLLNLGLAIAFEAKPGSHHGFEEVRWLSTALQLCWRYGNSLYAFRELAQAKASWGGGYSPETDAYKAKDAVRLERRFAAVPRSWRWPLGQGPLLLAVMFRHVGVLADPWDLCTCWRWT